MPRSFRYVLGCLEGDLAAITNMVCVGGGKRVVTCPYNFLDDLLPGASDRARNAFAKFCRRAEQISAIARKKHVLTFIRTYELDYTPFSMPEIAFLGDYDRRLWFIEEKIYEGLTSMPFLDGWIMTTSESPIQAETPEEVRSYALAGLRAVKRSSEESGRKKLLILRTWLSGRRECRILEYFPFKVPQSLKPYLMLETKNTVCDFSMIAPFNPLFGKVRDTPHLISFDIAGEYRGLAWFPCWMGERWKDHVNKALSRGVEGISFDWAHFGKKSLPSHDPKVGWGSGYPVREGPWANLNAFTLLRLTQDPSLAPESIAAEWIKRHYGERAVRTLLAYLKASPRAISKALHTLGSKHNDHSAFARPATSGERSATDRLQYTFVQIGCRFHPVEWGENGPTGRKHAFEYTEKELEAVLSEKSEARAAAAEMLCLIRSNRSSFRRSAYRSLLKDTEALIQYVDANRLYIEAFWRFKIWNRSKVGTQARREQLQGMLEIARRAHEIQLLPHDFPGKKGPKSFTILIDEILGMMIGDHGGYNVPGLPPPYP